MKDNKYDVERTANDRIKEVGDRNFQGREWIVIFVKVDLKGGLICRV